MHECAALNGCGSDDVRRDAGIDPATPDRRKSIADARATPALGTPRRHSPMKSLRHVRHLVAVAALVPASAAAQPATPAVWLEHTVDDELERYLRSLQALGAVPIDAWTIRPLSPPQMDRLRPASSAHPWGARLADADTSALRWAVVRSRVVSRYNSAFPFGGNDGAIWAGRGATVAASAGIAARWGSVSLHVEPIAFWAQNQSFPIAENGRTGPSAFGDAQYVTSVDRPQRFGDEAYARVDPGQSTLRVDALGATVGISTANVIWGPAQEFPFLLGTNAPGFTHLFAGTSRPVDLWIARLHSRLLYGRLEQSEYFEPTGRVQRARRFATGLLVAFTPRGMHNLEIGGARFFHAPWPDQGMPNRYLTRPFEGLFKTSLDEVEDPIETDSRSIDGENQLASVFARLVLPGTGFEVYGEIGREDHPWDLRHLILSPDEQSTFTVGLRKSWRRGTGAMGVVRAEAIDFRQRQVDRFRNGPATYVHGSGSNQGHTQRGQVLGADVGVGSSAGAVVGVDLVSAGGRTSFEWRRVLRAEGLTRPADDALDVVHTLGVERLMFRGSSELLLGADLSYNLNRNFAGDRANVSVRAAVTGLPFGTR